MQSLPMESLQKMSSFSVMHSYCNKFLPPVVPPFAPVLHIIPIAFVYSTHRVGLIVKALLPASFKGGEFDPFKFCKIYILLHHILILQKLE